jgi:hypothetical protein
LGAQTNFDTTRVRFGEMIAGISGFVLFISLFLEWYSISGSGPFASSQSAGRTGWQALGFIDILLFIIAVIAVATAVLRAMNAIPRQLPAAPGFILLVAGGIATLLVLFRLISPGDFGFPGLNDVPGVDISRSFGVFIAFLAAIGVTVGGWLTWNEEGKPMPGSAGAGAGGPGAGPSIGQAPAQPYGGQPAAGGQPQQQAYTPPAAGGAAPAAAAPAAQSAPAASAGAAKADWYPDPRGEKRLRYWDGSQWTDHTAD